jgi:hypothetical protein
MRFFTNVSKLEHQPSVMLFVDWLTRSTLLDFLCRNRKNREHFHYDLNDDIHHCLSWPHLGVSLETFEKMFDVLEKIDEYILTRIDILSRLTKKGVTIVHINECGEACPPKAAHQNPQKSLLQARIPEKYISDHRS